ncbi:hypothetical protein ARAM_000553 [Aspergillus rambellii]|uniref:Uncharacterized protein n=2 Tax=Aspergillus subgen. Nidulantes TaxID=2720870 RepID=A0A0F8UQX9_9EURO|nr:hypothetical protein ARAM_000553 [Aspergillus rambellii]KKK14096.1 hypothetical protein AOCH_000885 [Aspergillus ochraceoroseus]
MSFSALPNDLLLIIAECTEAQRDLSALTRCNHRLHHLLCNLLYTNNIRRFGSSGLVWAAVHGRLSVVQRMVGMGANIETRDESGWTPLDLAARNGHYAVVKLLLETGAEDQLYERHRWTPLCAAADGGYTRIVQLLLGADSMSGEFNADSPRRAINPEPRSGEELLLQMLFPKKGDSGNNSDVDLSIPLFLAAKNGHTAVASLLLADRRVHVNYQDASQRTPLMWAVSHSHAKTVKLLLENGADPSIEDCFNHTALLTAASDGNDGIVRILLAHNGSDPNCKDNKGDTPLTEAAKRGHVRVR